MEQFDVIVVGGGPAGIAAAITCLQGGIRPLLITDRPEQNPVDDQEETEPLQSLHPGAQSLLNQLHIGDSLARASKGTYTGIRVGKVISPLSTVPGETWTGNHIAPGLFAAHAIQLAQLMSVEV